MNELTQFISVLLLGTSLITTIVFIGSSMSDHRNAKLDKENPKRLELKQYKQGVKDSTIEIR